MTTEEVPARQLVDSPDEANFGELLRRHRQQTMLTQEQIAAYAGVSVRAVRYWESGRPSRPRADSVRRLVAALGLEGEDAAYFGRVARGTSETGCAAPARSGQPSAGLRNMATPAQLPNEVEPFVGRDRELFELTAWRNAADRRAAAERRNGAAAQSASLGIVTGTAGVGKTALVIRWAKREHRRFPDGQIFLDLRGFAPGKPRSSTNALARILAGLGLSPGAIPADPEDRSALLRSLMVGRKALIVLDNAASAEQVRPLLPGSTNSTVLITSRHELTGLVVEHGARRLTVQPLPPTEARRLLAIMLGVDARASRTHLDQLAALCAHLPLTLRVAGALGSARSGRSLGTLVADLTDAGRRLAWLSSSEDPRTATKAVLSWSYDALPAQAARVFRALGLHPGPDVDVNGMATLAGLPFDDATTAQQALQAAHLIRPARPSRFWTHDLLLAYARELAMSTDGVEAGAAARARLDQRLLARTLNAARRLYGDPAREPDAADDFVDADAARAWLRVDRPTLALPSWNPPPEVGIGISVALAQWLFDGSYNDDAHVIHARALDAARRVRDSAGIAAATYGLACTHWRWGNLDRAVQLLAEAAALSRQSGARHLEADILLACGRIAGLRTDYPRAERFFDEALEIGEQLGDHRRQANVVLHLGIIHERRGELDEALARYQRARRLAQEAGDDVVQAKALLSVGIIANQRQDAAAETHYQAALALATGAETYLLRGHIYAAMADEYLRQGRPRRAIGTHRRALAVFRGLRDPHGAAWARLGIAESTLGLDDPDRALKRFTQALQAFESVDQAGVIDAHIGMGTALMKLQRPEEAIVHYDSARTLAESVGQHPELVQATARLAWAQASSGAYRAAREHWDTAKRLAAAIHVAPPSEVEEALTKMLT